MSAENRREHFAKDPKTSDLRLAEAFVLDNLPMRIYARFYKFKHRPKNPVKIFSSREKAINWLDNIYVMHQMSLKKEQIEMS